MQETLLPVDARHPSASERAAAGRRRELSIWLPLIALISFCSLLAVAGVFLLLPLQYPLAAFLGFAADDPVLRPLAISVIVFAGTAPLLSLFVRVLWAAPSRSSRARDAVFADARLEEICSSAVALRDVYDVIGAADAPCTALMIAGGAGAPREVLRGLARRLAAAQGVRVLLVDVPAHGALAAVTFSLARTERVLLAVMAHERAQRVVLVAFSAAAYIAAAFAASHAAALDGLVLLGFPPTVSSLLYIRARILRLEWAAELASLAVRGRIANHQRATEADKEELGEATWTFSALADVLRELGGVHSGPHPLLHSLRSLPAPLMVLGPAVWILRARRIISHASVRFVVGGGVRDTVLPTLVDAKQAILAAALAKFVREATATSAAARTAATASAGLETAARGMSTGSSDGLDEVRRKGSSLTIGSRRLFGGGSLSGIHRMRAGIASPLAARSSVDRGAADSLSGSIALSGGGSTGSSPPWGGTRGTFTSEGGSGVTGRRGSSDGRISVGN
jgi:pimeloyl-ACP methyl ester carboxylesterase